jgi:hypothetical protein
MDARGRSIADRAVARLDIGTVLRFLQTARWGGGLKLRHISDTDSLERELRSVLGTRLGIRVNDALRKWELAGFFDTQPLDEETLRDSRI